MLQFCFWSLALGTAPLVLGALWDQLELCYRRSAGLRANTVRLGLDEIGTRAATVGADARLRPDSTGPRAGAQSHLLHVR